MFETVRELVVCKWVKGKLTTCKMVSSLEYFGQRFLLGVGRALRSMSEGVMHFCVTPITVWVVSKNESNCLSENKMVSTLNWRHVSFLYVVQSNLLWLTILLSYHYRCNVVFTNCRFPVSFSLYIATQKGNQIITVNSSTNTPITQKITLACLCFSASWGERLCRGW